MTNNVSILVRR